MHASTKSWAVMILLTLLAAAALASGLNRLVPLAWIAALGLVTLVKGRLILLDFLELRASGGWRRAIVSGYAAAVTLIFAGLAIGSY